MDLTTGGLRNALYRQFPIVEHVFEKNSGLLTMRPVDMNWYYNGIVPISVCGFNPFGSQIFYGQNSYLQKFLKQDIAINPGEIDWYLYEVFFAVHDYMHLWTVNQLLVFFPECTETDVFSNRESLEDLAYILLISEVVAAVSIDWWLLSEVDFAKLVHEKSKFRCLTTSFKMQDLAAARAINPSFSVRDKSFFFWLADGFFANIFAGFDGFEEQTTTLPWLKKELQYGVKQRDLLSSWLDFLSDCGSDRRNNIRFSYATAQRSAAMDFLASKVWELVNSAKLPSLQLCFEKWVPLPQQVSSLNFEFVDASYFVSGLRNIDTTAMSDRNFAYLTAQLVSFQDWNPQTSCSPQIFDRIVTGRNMQHLITIADGLGPIPVISKSPHLFIPN